VQNGDKDNDLVHPGGPRFGLAGFTEDVLQSREAHSGNEHTVLENSEARHAMGASKKIKRVSEKRTICECDRELDI
jgi:hypothetical protein